MKNQYPALLTEDDVIRYYRRYKFRSGMWILVVMAVLAFCASSCMTPDKFRSQIISGHMKFPEVLPVYCERYTPKVSDMKRDTVRETLPGEPILVPYAVTVDCDSARKASGKDTGNKVTVKGTAVAKPDSIRKEIIGIPYEDGRRIRTLSDSLNTVQSKLDTKAGEKSTWKTVTFVCFGVIVLLIGVLIWSLRKAASSAVKEVV